MYKVVSELTDWLPTTNKCCRTTAGWLPCWRCYFPWIVQLLMVCRCCRTFWWRNISFRVPLFMRQLNLNERSNFFVDTSFLLSNYQLQINVVVHFVKEILLPPISDVGSLICSWKQWLNYFIIESSRRLIFCTMLPVHG